MTGSMWPNADLSERAKCTREKCVKAVSGNRSWMIGFDVGHYHSNKGLVFLLPSQ